MFDRKRCINNIIREAKEQNKKLGKLEAAGGQSPGFLSRINNNDGKGNFNVEFFYALSEQLGRTMDYLANYDENVPMTDSERYVLDFVDQLTFASERYNTEWEKMDAGILNPEYLFEHPLFSQTVWEGEHGFTGEFVQHDVMRYNSKFDETAKINGYCYYASLEGKIGSAIYIMNVKYQVKDDSFSSQKNSYEIYFIDENENTTPVVSSYYAIEPLKTAIEKLYNCIENAQSHVTLNDVSKSHIKRYMAYMKALSELSNQSEEGCE